VSTIGILGAFLGGILSLISPCSALLLPIFFAYSFDRMGKLLSRTALLYLGLCITLVPLGTGLGAIGSFFDNIRPTVMLVAGIIIIVFGAMTMLGQGFAFRPAQEAMGKLSGKSALSVLLLGCVYGLAGFCSGPILGSILTIAVAGGSAAYGALLMAVYALGMAAPLFLLAFLWERFNLSEKKWLRGKNFKIGKATFNSTSFISGLLFIVIGALFIATEGTSGMGGLLSSEQQFNLEVWASNFGDSSTNLLVILLIILIVALSLVVHIMRKKRRAQATGELDDGADESSEPEVVEARVTDVNAPNGEQTAETAETAEQDNTQN